MKTKGLEQLNPNDHTHPWREPCTPARPGYVDDHPTGFTPAGFTVHKRLLEGAIDDVARKDAENVQSRVCAQIAEVVERVAVAAYTRGVRDGYVQAVAECEERVGAEPADSPCVYPDHVQRRYRGV